jgi:hypothetical protein
MAARSRFLFLQNMFAILPQNPRAGAEGGRKTERTEKKDKPAERKKSANTSTPTARI